LVHFSVSGTARRSSTYVVLCEVLVRNLGEEVVGLDDTTCAPTVPNPVRLQKAIPLLETGGPMTARVVTAGAAASAGGPGAARGSTTGLARPRPPHFLGPSGGGWTTAVADSALGCATLLCSGCILGWPPALFPLPPPLLEAAAWHLGGGGEGGVIADEVLHG
jgi:hypothetical protein